MYVRAWIVCTVRLVEATGCQLSRLVVIPVSLSDIPVSMSGCYSSFVVFRCHLLQSSRDLLQLSRDLLQLSRTPVSHYQAR